MLVCVCVSVYPVIHLFYVCVYIRFGPIEYKGPLKASYVESFILRVITPLTYLPSRATLLHFLSHHQVQPSPAPTHTHTHNTIKYLH